MDSWLVQSSNPDSRTGRELECCTGFCPALHRGWISVITYYDCTVKHIILAACEPWHGGLESNPRYVVTHHPIHWRNSPLGIHGGAPYYQSFILVTFCGTICWVQLDSSPEPGFCIVKNLVLRSARHSALWDEFSKALHRRMEEKMLPLVPRNLLSYLKLEMHVKALLGLWSEAPCKTDPLMQTRSLFINRQNLVNTVWH